MPLSALIAEPLGERAKTLAGKYAGRSLLIVGSGRCLWDDCLKLDPTGKPPEGFDVMAVNEALLHYNHPVEHAYSNHGDRLLPWTECRVLHFNKPAHLHSNGDWGNHVVHWPVPGMGSSGLCACVVGLLLGYDRIVLAGIPLDDAGHFYDPPWRESNFTREAPTDIWVHYSSAVFDGRVRSLSGRSAEICGQP